MKKIKNVFATFLFSSFISYFMKTPNFTSIFIHVQVAAASLCVTWERGRCWGVLSNCMVGKVWRELRQI